MCRYCDIYIHSGVHTSSKGVFGLCCSIVITKEKKEQSVSTFYRGLIRATFQPLLLYKCVIINTYYASRALHIYPSM